MVRKIFELFRAEARRWRDDSIASKEPSVSPATISHKKISPDPLLYLSGMSKLTGRIPGRSN